MRKAKHGHIGTLSEDHKYIFPTADPIPEYSRIAMIEVRDKDNKIIGVDAVWVNGERVPFNFDDGLLILFPDAEGEMVKI